MAKFVNKNLIVVVIVTIVLELCSGSAIPMWEYLSRGEKMSHLYSTFAKQVSSYCKTSGDLQPASCKRELLMYGLGKLHDMSETHLDSMDPYQRGANDIIWDSMMDGHPSHPKKQVTTPSTIMYPTGTYMKNPLFDDKPMIGSSKMPIMTDKYDDMELGTFTGHDFSEPQNYIHQELPTNVNYQFAAYPSAQSFYSKKNNFLSGPMVIRVRPDGTPVEEDRKRPLPRDDDRVEMQIGHEKLPTIDQIAEIFKMDQSTTKKFQPTQMVKLASATSSYTPPAYNKSYARQVQRMAELNRQNQQQQQH